MKKGTASAPYCGYYKHHYLRSYGEFIFALYLEFVEQVNFTCGDKAIKGRSSKKIPDFLVYDKNNNLEEIIEIKNSIDQSRTVAENYMVEEYYHAGSDNHYFSYGRKTIIDYRKEHPFDKTMFYRFITMNLKMTNRKIKEIKNKIGDDCFNILNAEYRSQRGQVTQEGFVGELNPMWGKKHSDVTKEKIAVAQKDWLSDPMNNPMYGKTHTECAKKKIAAKWNDPEKKTNMLRNGYRTMFTRLNIEQRAEYYKYSKEVFSGNKHSLPKGVNFCYSVTNKEKINNLFGSKENFLRFLEDISREQFVYEQT